MERVRGCKGRAGGTCSAGISYSVKLNRRLERLAERERKAKIPVEILALYRLFPLSIPTYFRFRAQ